MTTTHPMRVRRRLLQVLPILAVLAVGVGVAAFLVRTRPQPEQAPREQRAPIVEVARARQGTQRLTVRAQGTVIPSRQVALHPEVSGRVEWLSEELTPGGVVREGQPLLRLDERNYRLALRQQAAEVQRARAELQLEQARARVAEREWELLGLDSPEEQQGSALALREPQLRAAQDALEAARGAQQRARLDLARTRLRAPFNALVLEESVEVGQVLGPQAPVVTLVGTDSFWVQVSVPRDRVSVIPGASVVPGDSPGAPVRVWQDVNGERVVREGRVVRLLGDLDPRGRMARLLVEIEDPLGLQPSAEGGLEPTVPLLLGTFVNVEIDAGTRQDVVAVPLEALRDEDTVYVLSDEGTLDIRDVQVVWREPQRVLVAEGLEGGERLVTSRLPGAVEGMRLRAQGAEEAEGGRLGRTGRGGGARPRP